MSKICQDRDDKELIDREHEDSEDLHVKRCPSHTKVASENPENGAKFS